MATMPHENPRLDGRTLRRFPTPVAKMLQELANTYGVRWRMAKDGNHVFLYPPREIAGDPNSTRPFKVGSHRPVDQAMRYLEGWVEDYVRPWLMERQQEALASKFNDPTKRQKAAVEPAVEPVAPQPTPEPPAPQDPAPASPAPDPEGEDPLTFESDPQADGLDDLMPPEGYEQWYTQERHSGRRSVKSNWWKKVGENEWVCKTCGHTQRGDRLEGSHQKSHKDAREIAAAAATARAKKGARTRKIKRAMLMLSEATGVDLGDNTALEKKVERLTADLAKVTKERDDYKARLDLIKEGLRA